MLTLILIPSLSFIVLITMISLRWFNCSLGEGSVCYRVFKLSDSYLGKHFSFMKRFFGKYGNGLLVFVLIKKFFVFQAIRLYNWFIILLKKTNGRFGKLLKKASLKKEGETVSEYLRSISDYDGDQNKGQEKEDI